MKAEQIFGLAPGTVTLLWCAGLSREDAIYSIVSAMPEAFKRRTELNECSCVQMTVTGESDPNSFRSLSSLYAKLIRAAGTQSHYAGLLLLDIAGLTEHGTDRDRLRALGELLTVEDGPASRCVTLLLGPEKENDMLLAADLLDFDGRLEVTEYEDASRRPQLRELMRSSGLRCDGAESEKLTSRALKELAEVRRFDPVRFLRSCAGPEGVITAGSVRDALTEPFSYVNRLKRMNAIGPERRREPVIGFQADH